MRKFISIIILVAFLGTCKKPPAYAQEAQQGMIPRLPVPGVMVHLSPEFTPAHLQGITIHPDNALQFDFLIHKGDKILEGDQKEEEYKKLVKYFLASLTIPDEDQWVNLSPYENDRIIKDDFGKTEMGRDLLSEDYLLKQITSSLIYPEDGLGKKFWDKVYERAWSEYHTTNIPVNTFNKVWIVPDQAIVYESGNTAYILKSHLKVMLEEDYLSMSKHADVGMPTRDATHSIGSQVIRDIILPELEKEVNEGKNFANLRQMYSGMILATWYKKDLKESLLGKVYADQAKVQGVTGIMSTDPGVIANSAKQSQQQIYQQYLKAFKKGVFNYIKEDVDKYTQEAIPRKYFSGGFHRDPAMAGRNGDVTVIHSGQPIPGPIDLAALAEADIDRATISLETPKDAAMTAAQVEETQVEETKVLEHSEKPLEIDYLKPIVLNLPNGLILKISKIEDMDERDPAKGQVNSFAGYVITDGEGGFKALRDQEEVRLGREYNRDKFTALRIKSSGISRGHITISRRGDIITLFDGVVDDFRVYKPSTHGTTVQYTRVRPAMIAQDEIGAVSAKDILTTMDDIWGKLKFLPEESSGRKAVMESLDKLKQYLDPFLNRSVHVPGSSAIMPLIFTISYALFLKNQGLINGTTLEGVLVNTASLLLASTAALSEGNFSSLKAYVGALPEGPARDHAMAALREKVSIPMRVTMILTGLAFGAASLLSAVILYAEIINHRTDPQPLLGAMTIGFAVISVGSFLHVRGRPLEVMDDDQIKELLFTKIKKLFEELALQHEYDVTEELKKLNELEERAKLGIPKNSQAAWDLEDAIINFIRSTLDDLYRQNPSEIKGRSIEQLISYLQQMLKGWDEFKRRSREQESYRALHFEPSPEQAAEDAEAARRFNEERRRTLLEEGLIQGDRQSPPEQPKGRPNLGVIDGGRKDKAQLTPGGIDMNSANLALQIKRDGRGVPLPLALQDMAQLSRIQGFVPEIIEIRPAVNLPILSELQQKLQPSTS